MKFNASWVMVTLGPPVERETHTNEDITFPQLCWQVVIKIRISVNDVGLKTISR